MKTKLNRRVCCVLLVGMLSSLCCSVMWAQSTAQISGSVRDQSGAVLPGVEIAVTQTDTGLRRSMPTDETGSYVLTNLPVGPYRLEATLPGFRTYVQTGILLQVGSNPTVNAVLEVGQLSDQIEVQADAALVETRSTGVGQLIDNTRVLELPLNGRQVTELVLLSGVANVSRGTALTSNRNYPTIAISVAGGLANGLTYMLDGSTHNDPANNLNLPLPFPDALQEFRVETSGLQAQYGHHSSGAVNAVTKSGTNEFHGSAFEFLRNGSLNARNAFALLNDGLKRNQFGGTIGGPILKNKLFFFGGTQVTTERSRPSDQRQFIPTAAMLAGDFTVKASPACNSGRQLTLAAPFVGNRVDPATYSPAALNLVKRLPTTTDPCGELRFGRQAKNDEYITVGRGDYQWNDKHSLFFRYSEARRNLPTDLDESNILTLSRGNEVNRVYSGSLGDTYLIGANTVSSFHATLNRSKIAKTPPEFFDLADLGVKNVWIPYPKYSMVTITNGFTIAGSQPNPGNYNTTSFQFAEDLSLIRGAHQVGLGVNYVHTNMNGKSSIATGAGVTFNGQFSTLGLADLLLGRPSGYRQDSRNVFDPRQHYVGVYGQDTWRTSNTLTVNLGLRWEPFMPPHSARSETVFFDQAAFDAGIKSTVYTNAPPGLKFPGDPGVSAKFGDNRWLHFAPRIGFAWNPSGDGRMTVRAAYGLFFDTPQMYQWSGAGVASPYGTLIDLLPPASFDNPWANFSGGNPFPTWRTKDFPFPNNVAYPNYIRDNTTNYAHQWNLSLQKQIGTDWLAAASYIANSTIHITVNEAGNPVIYLPDATCVIAGRTYTPCSSTSNTSQRRRLFLQDPVKGAAYAQLANVTDDGTASYNGLLLTVQRRRANGVTVLGNYTWSHCIGDELTPYGPTGALNAANPGRRRLDRGNCNADVRHNANVSTVVNTPQFANTALRLIASGWQVSGILRIQSGGYFTVTSGFDTALTGLPGRANQVLQDPYAPGKTVDQWLNPAAFVRPPNGDFGNAANSIQGPGTIRIDMGLSRTVRITENQSIQFRAEAFNLPNHMNPMSPIAALNNPNFGKIQTADDPRILQLALKYVF